MREKPLVALIYPPWLEERTHTEDVACVPMGTYAVAAALIEAGCDARVLDWHALRGQPEAMREELRALAPDVVGVTVLQANRFGAMDAARLARELDPGVRVVFGGVGATALWAFFLEHCPELDAVALGEGDLTMPELVRAWQAGAGPACVPGLALRGPDGPVCTAARPPVADLDSLPIPARHFTYQHLSLTRGCPGRCTFCGSPAFWGPRVRFRSPGHFVDEMELLAARGVTHLYVSDDTFTLDRERVRAVCREILARGLDVEWQAISRVNAVDDQTLALMRRAGCIQISFGVESGDDAIRAALNKNVRREDAVRAFALCRKYGILARAYFIYGCPGESDATIRATLDLIAELRPLVVHFFILSVFPGTELYERFKAATGAADSIWLDPVEDIKHFELDPAQDLDTVAAWGQALRAGFHAMLPGFALGAADDLAPDPELARLHADFLARLGMTFERGDYARDPQVPRAQEIAAQLYARALEFHPDATAALGLGLMLQRQRDYGASVRALALGLTANPGHEGLSLALAVALMNCGDFERACAFLTPFGGNPQAMDYLALCHRHLGHPEREAQALAHARALRQGRPVPGAGGGAIAGKPDAQD